ncbi:MAG: hypothetical protein HYT82_01040 [Candidatus Harrisonbacteria bacterium]|nr:hypothetical protein [Candidatus Harrisonbacteria bacterium]
MGKLTKYLIVMSGLMLIFYFMGLVEKTPNSILLNFVLDPISFQASTLYIKVIAALELVAGATIVVGSIFGQRTELIITATFSIYMFNLFWDFMAVFSAVANANFVIALLLFSPLMVVYIVTVIEWFREMTT